MPRLVQCPKCAVLLTEPSGTPIYQCGNCTTTLRTRPVTPENAGEAPPEEDPSWRRMSPPPAHDWDQARAPELLLMRPASPYKDPAYYPAPAPAQGERHGSAAVEGYSYNRFFDNPSPDQHRSVPPSRAYNTDAGAGPSPANPNAPYGNARSPPRDFALLPKSIRDKVFSAAALPGPVTSGFEFRPYDGLLEEEQQPQVQFSVPQKGLRWKPRPDHEDAVPRHGQGLGPAGAEEEQQQWEPDRVVDIYEAPEETPDYEPSEHSSSFSDPDGSRLSDPEFNSEVGLGTVPEYGVAKHDAAHATGLATRLAAAVPDNVQVPSPAGDGFRPFTSPHVKAQLSPPAWLRGVQGHVQEPSVTMPSDLFRKEATESRSAYDGPRFPALQEHQLAAAAAAPAPAPVAAAGQGGYASDYGLPEPHHLVMERRIDTFVEEEDVHPQHTQERSARGSSSPGASSYSYKWNVLQPSENLERSQDALSSPNENSKPHPPFPSLRDPPYVVCQHCLQLLVLPKVLPPLSLTRRTQKVRCGSCNRVSVYAVEQAVGDAVSPSQFAGQFALLGFGQEPQLGAGGGSGVGRIHSPVVIDVPSPGPRQLPSPTLGPAGNNYKSTAARDNGSGSCDRPGLELGPEVPDLTGALCSVHGSSDSESDSVKGGLPYGVAPQDDPSSVHDESVTYPSLHHGGDDSWGKSRVASIFKGFKDLTIKAGQGKMYRRHVFVNGRPIPDPIVKKAEESAGPIHPGNYWYDAHAGFWGVMGGPCQGIIPPFIEELNHPLPRDCSGGKTGVIVNGRDLHKVDLDILAKRGLPTTPGMSYRVEIDGRVTDEGTGQVLKSLGRLAPSVEKKRRGHGMVVK